MAALMPGLPSQRGVGIRPEEEEEEEVVEIQSRKWYFSRQEIEELSPSRKDGVDLETESRLRKLYCSFIKEIGMKLKVPQVAIACAMMLCHRFYMRQSHAKNDWQTIATVSVFLACKLEETPRSLTDVVVKAYELTYKWDPSAPERIRKVEFANKQKELIVIGERLLLATLAFDLDIQLPYKPLVDALRKLGLFQLLGQVAWNFVNDWLCTTLCLQYKPHYTAAGALFLAAKFKKVKVPKEKGKVWWLEFDVSPKQLEEVIQYMLRLLEEEKIGKLPQNHDKAIQSRALVGKQIVNSPQSTITSVSTSNSHSSNGAEIESLASSERNLGVKEVSLCQMSDSSASSIVEDGDGESQPKAGESDCRIVPIPPSYHNVDTEKIGEALKTGRCQGFTIEKSTEAMTSKMDSEAFIERELENGIVLESASTKSKQRDANAGTVIESMGSDERTVGVVVLHHLPSSMSIISIVGDGDKETLPRTEDLELGSTCQIVSVHSSHLKIDSSKIREKLKRRRGELAASKLCNEPTNIDINSEAWIERELENGIELEFASSGKKQKVV